MLSCSLGESDVMLSCSLGESNVVITFGIGRGGVELESEGLRGVEPTGWGLERKINSE